MSDVFFTIVIPTKNRADTLRYSLQSALSQSYDNYRIIVSDNCSEDNTQELVASFNDARITYVNPGRRLSMSSHWEFALSFVDEGMVTILGDDDALLPSALSRVNYLIGLTGASAVRSVLGLYYWPGFLGTGSESQLTTLVSSGFQIRDSCIYLQRVLDGRLGYGELPMLYTGGFVHTSVVNRVRKSNKILFASVNPDIYSAIANSLCLDSYVYSFEPFALGGHSIHSNGAAHLRGLQDSKSRELRKQFALENDRSLHPALCRQSFEELPRSMQLYVCEAYLQSSHLHQLKHIRFSLKSQAKIIASLPTQDLLLTKQFLRDFAAANKFTLENAPPSFFNFWYFLIVLDKFIKAIFNMPFKIFLQGQPAQPVSNVYQAATIAGFLLLRKPSRLTCIFSSFKKMITAHKVFSW